MNKDFESSGRNRVRRVAKRGIYDRESIYSVIDNAPIGHIGFNDPEHGVTVIPMLHARLQDDLIFHGATTSRLMKQLSDGQTICVSFGLVDGLVLAKSLFHHSMNYRSVVAYGTGRLVIDTDEKLAALKVISDKLVPQRWEDAREPNTQEMKATSVVKLKMESASAKIRTGPPHDDAEDLALPVWSGIVPFETQVLSPVADEHSTHIDLPEYLTRYSR